MQKVAAVLLALACTQPVVGMRIGARKTAAKEAASSAAETTSGFDLLMCDQMCMQCPSGRNILIQRQKSGLSNGFALAAGAFSFGTLFPVVSQLTGCDKVGFQFWKDRELAAEQPLQTESLLGVMFVNSGLEKLHEKTDKKTPDSDLDALEHCEQLSSAYMWQALHGAFAGGAFERQQDFARKCLSHSALCGKELEWTDDTLGDNATLNVDRLNPFAHESMCAAPKEGSMEGDASEMSEYDKILLAAGGFPGPSSRPSTGAMEGEGSSVDPPVGLQLLLPENQKDPPAGIYDRVNMVVPNDQKGPKGAGTSKFRDIVERIISIRRVLNNMKGDSSKDGEEDPGEDLAGVDADGGNDGEDSVEDNSETVAPGSKDLGQTLGDSSGEGNSGEQKNVSPQPSGDVEFEPIAIVSDAILSAVTVEEAGKALDAAVEDKDYSTTHSFCRSEKQQARCNQLGFATTAHCKDRCCLDVCNFHFKVKASCIMKCVRG